MAKLPKRPEPGGSTAASAGAEEIKKGADVPQKAHIGDPIGKIGLFRSMGRRKVWIDFG